MAETVLTIVFGFITDPIKKYVFAPMKTQISYAFKCDSKVEKLQDGVKQLQKKTLRLQDSVDAKTRNGEDIYSDVIESLSAAKKEIDEAEKLIQGKEDAKKKKCFVGFCPNLKTWYQLGKSAEKQASAIDKLMNEFPQFHFDEIASRPPPQQIVEPSVYSREGLPSRVLLLTQIMDALIDPNLNMVGVHGMGGVGKTTLAKEVHGKAVAEKLFDAVIMVAVSQTPEFRRIQVELADFLGLKFEAEELPGRASQLYKRLENSKVLIILDDLWQKLDLYAIGIPSGDLSKGCKILLTSRSMDLLSSEMCAQKLFSLEALKEDETWRLFEMSVAEAKDPQFHAVATKIANKCAGLPLLIQLVATELRNKESYEWNNKLNQLSALGDEEIYERVYKVLKSSYDNLPGEEIKSFFLLCAMFGQSNIQIKYLLTHSMSLGLFKHIRSIEGGRDKVFTLINKLKAKSLLLDGDMVGFVKMHDVVRDTALSIASRVQHAFIGSGELRSSNWPNKNCTRISFPYSDVRELPEGLDCPEAELFLLFTEDLCLEIPDSFFRGINKLKVVDLMGMRLVSLPSSISLLINLQTLCLHRCRLDNVAIVGELKQLESLSFSNSNIVELPREIEALTRLKLLNLNNCSNLKVIPENVLSKLCLLEELYMLDSFVRWNAKGNARLVELDSLSHLSTLEIQIVNSNLLPQSCMFFCGLRSYKISIGNGWGYWGGNDERSTALKLKLDAGIHLVDGLKLLLKGAEDLYLSEGREIESVLYDLDLDREGFPQLKHLHIHKDYGIHHLIKSRMRASCHAFPILESLNLKNLMSLETIHYGQLEMGSFGELRILKISRCDKLKRLFSLSSSKCLPQLREMEVDSCGNMEAIVGQEGEVEHYNVEVIESSQLSSLKLRNLPHLKGFCKLNERSESAELLFIEMVSFPNLTSLEVYNCQSLKYVFTASMMKCLMKLKKLDISECELVEEIIQSKKDEEIEQESINAILFPNLDYLRFENLPNVKSFSCGYSIEFPLLRELRMRSCSAMKNFVSKVSSNESDDQEEYLFNEMVTFSSLEKMEVEDMSFKYLWDEQFAADHDSFSKLILLRIAKCSKLSIVFPSNACRRFQRVETLYLSDCDGVEEIYEYQNKIEAFSLRDLKIFHLRSLKNIWSNNPCGSFTFENLQSVTITGACPDLKYVFPASIASGLLQLQKLRICNCNNMEVVIAKEKDEISDPSFQFLELTTLELEDLRKMRSLYEGDHTFECPKLKSLQVLQVPTIFVDKFIGNNLEELSIDGKTFEAIQLQSGKFPVEFLYKLKKLTLLRLREESIPVVFGFLRRLTALEMLVFEFCHVEEMFFELDNERPIGVDQEQLHHLITLKHLELRWVSKLQQIIRKKDSQLNRSILQHLHTLNVNECYDLVNIAPQSASFHNLTTLCVKWCNKMKSLVTASIAKTMVQLMELKVIHCNMLEEIVTKDHGDHDTEHHDVIIFSKLKRLELTDLYKLNSFCSHSYTFSFPLLEQVTVYGCPTMKIFCRGDLSTPKLRGILYYNEQQWEGNLNDTITSQLRKWVGEHLEEGRVFKNVESVEVVKDAICSKAILANQMQFLNKLRKITVRDCESVQVVFDLEGLSAEGRYVGLLSQLDEIQLTNLPMLSQLCNKAPRGILDFNNLEVLKIDRCGRLEYVFTWSMASCLFHLRCIELKNCKMLETIIKEEVEDVILGSLKSIVVECLPKFSNFYSGNGDLECPSLKKARIRECPSMKAFISREDRQGNEEHNSIHFSHKFIPNLKELEIDDQSLRAAHQSGNFSRGGFFSRLEKVTLLSFKEEPIPSLLGVLRRLWSSETLNLSDCSFQEISVLDDERANGEEEHQLRAKHLKLWRVSKLKHMLMKNDSLLNLILQNLHTLNVQFCHDLINIAQSSASFRNLTTLIVGYCNKMTSLVTASAAKTMEQLMELSVSGCCLMEEIVASDADCKERVGIIFNKLKSLKLTKLDRLNSFCSGDYAFGFPLLEEVNVKSCSRMKVFCCGDVNTPKLRGIQWEDDQQQWEGNLNVTIACQLKKWVGGHFEEGRLFRNVESVEVVKDAICSKAILANGMQFLNKLREITVRDCASVQVVFDLEGLSAEDGNAWLLPELNKLMLINLPLLTQLCNKALGGILEFNKLKFLKIEKCSRLEYLFTWSVASCLFHLERIVVNNCEMMETLIKEEEADDATRVIFCSLECIVVECLPKFSSIYSGSGVLECPSLKRIGMIDCPSIKSFISSSTMEDREDTEKHNLIHSSHKVFPKLEELSLNIKSITAILQFGLPTNFFSKVKNLRLVYNSATPKSHVLLLHFLSRLPNLHYVNVWNSSVKELFKFEGLSNSVEEVATVLPRIKTLRLEDLDGLKRIWWQNSQSHTQQFPSFENLQSLKVDDCGNLRFIFDLSMALSLPNLEHLEVKNCSLVEHIVAQGEDEEMQKQQRIFPSLQSMHLHCLTNLLSFYSASGFLECPTLKMIEVVECPNMQLFASSFSNGQGSCMIAEEKEESISNEIMFLGKKIAIPGLEELKVEWNSLKGILYGDNRPEFLNKLKHIELTGFQGEDYAILPSIFLQHFPKLEKLALSDASIEEVNLQELSILKGENAESLVLLTKLKLSNLPKLKHLVHDDSQLVPLFQNLEDLEVVECSRLENLVPSAMAFQSLTNLEVSKCDGLINLMTAPTARSLVQLRRINVKGCKMMREIVAIASERVEYEIRFSQLEYLGLDDLACLTSFCLGNYAFHFPSLKEVMVTGCPSMKIFAEQVPTAPKLWKVKTGRHEYDWEWAGNLNNTIQSLFDGKDVEETNT